ncbi:MAG: hypothetical protein U0528_16635 [Anaerolineae bacterium]
MRFFRTFFFVMLIALVSQLTPRLIGDRRTSSPLSIVMTGPDGVACARLCLFGIVPGETSIEQAATILRSHPLTRDALWFDNRTLKLSGPDTYIAFSYKRDGLVDSIALSDNLDDSGIAVPGSLVASIVIGDLIDAFGVPQVMIPGSEYFVVSFPSVGIMAASVRPRDFNFHFQPRTSLSMVMISTNLPCPKQGAILQVHTWMGFTSIKRYFADLQLASVLHRTSGVPVPPYASCRN